jgi:hypothetical protein
VRPEDRQKTAVITPLGLFELLRMPFGLRNAGSSFQRMMDWGLTGLPFAYCYPDDLRIVNPDCESHQQHLRLIFERLACMRADIASLCRDCVACQLVKVTKQPRAPIQPIPIPPRRFNHVHVDLVAPLPVSEDGFMYIMTIGS